MVDRMILGLHRASAYHATYNARGPDNDDRAKVVLEFSA
jgi:hypothetical protein